MNPSPKLQMRLSLPELSDSNVCPAEPLTDQDNLANLIDNYTSCATGHSGRVRTCGRR